MTGNLSCWLCDVSVSSGASAADVDESGDAVVGSRGGDQAAAVGVADENRRA